MHGLLLSPELNHMRQKALGNRLPGAFVIHKLCCIFLGMTDYYAELTADLDAIGVEIEKASSRSEAGRKAAMARWAGHSKKGGAPKMVPGGWRSAAGIPAAEQESNARSKAGMQGARTRAQNKDAEQQTVATGGRSRRAAAARAAASARFDAKGLGSPKIGQGPNHAASKRISAEQQKKYGISADDLKATKKKITSSFEIAKGKMSRSEAGRVAARARWGNSASGKIKAGTPIQSPSDPKSGADIKAEMERAGVPKRTIDAIEKNPGGPATIREMTAHRKRVQEYKGLTAPQKIKYDEKMDMPTPDLSPELKHQDAMMHALDPKSPRPKLPPDQQDVFWEGKAGTRPPIAYGVKPQ